jgi:hypothetical protein
VATPPGYALCSYELKHSLQSRSAYLTFGVDCSATDPTTVASNVRAAFITPGSLFSIIDDNVTLQNTRVSLGTDGAEDIVGSNPTTAVCTRGISSLPANCAVLMHKQTARGGRRGRGRMYIPWANSVTAVGEGGALSVPEVAQLQLAVNVWFNHLSTGNNPLVVLHRPSTGTIGPGTAPGAPNVVTAVTIDPLVATQRRRLGR